MNIINLDQYKDFAGREMLDYRVDTSEIFLGDEYEYKLAKSLMDDWVKSNPMPAFSKKRNYNDYQLSGCGLASIIFVLEKLRCGKVDFDELLEFAEKHNYYDRWAGMKMSDMEKCLGDYAKKVHGKNIITEHSYLKNGHELQSILDRGDYVIANVWANYDKPNIGDEEGGHYIVFTGQNYQYNNKTFYITADRYFAKNSILPMHELWGFVGITMKGFDRIRFDYDYRDDTIVKKEKLMDENLITQAGLTWHFGEVIIVHPNFKDIS